MNNIVKRIKELGFDSYACVTYDNIKYIVVFMAYKYYRETDNNNYPASPYYFASNRAYFASKALAEYICEQGYMAEVRNHILYDNVLEECGALRGENNLFYIEDIGSLFCVHLIETDAPMEEKRLKGIECTHCKKCIKYCPMNALTEEGLNGEICLRERMDIIGDTMCQDKISTLLGCDKCQKVCPNNSHEIEEKTYPQFNKEKILKGDITGLAELVGKNMARKQRLQFQGLCISTNMEEKDKLESIEQIASENLENTVKWSVDRLKKC